MALRLTEGLGLARDGLLTRVALIDYAEDSAIASFDIQGVRFAGEAPRAIRLWLDCTKPGQRFIRLSANAHRTYRPIRRFDVDGGEVVAFWVVGECNDLNVQAVEPEQPFNGLVPVPFLDMDGLLIV